MFNLGSHKKEPLASCQTILWPKTTDDSDPTSTSPGNAIIDLSVLRVMLPTAMCKTSTEAQRTGRYPEPTLCDSPPLARITADDTDQHHTLHSRKSSVRKDLLPSMEAGVKEEQLANQRADTDLERDASDSRARRKRLGKSSRFALVNQSLHSHTLGACWWTEYAINDEDSEVVLPEAIWRIHSTLQEGAPDILSARLSLSRQLARTEYSNVYEATLDQTTPVVVKVLDLSKRPLIANALAEASVLDSLRGWKGCVQLMGCGRTSSGQVQLVLQKCDEDLRHWRRRTLHLSPLRLLSTFQGAVELVSDLHKRGVAHCDLKMDNILLLNGQLLLADFSEAVAFSSPEQAKLRDCRGTQCYECPEMCIGDTTDARAADVWALGCLLYELVVGADACLFSRPCSCLRAVENGPDWWEEKELHALQHACSGFVQMPGLFEDIKGLLEAMLTSPQQRLTSKQVLHRTSDVLQRLQAYCQSAAERRRSAFVVRR
ncbi:kinase-like domain-containing protein [Haematococcus lacustris]